MATTVDDGEPFAAPDNENVASRKSLGQMHREIVRSLASKHIKVRVEEVDDFII
jgi:hypothetical protein